MEKMPSISIAIKITITIPHLTVKSLGVKIAYMLNPNTIATNNSILTEGHHSSHHYNLVTILLSNDGTDITHHIPLTQSKEKKKNHIYGEFPTSRAAENGDFRDEHDADTYPHEPVVLDLELEEGLGVEGSKAHGCSEEELDGEDDVDFHDELFAGTTIQTFIKVSDRILPTVLHGLPLHGCAVRIFECIIVVILVVGVDIVVCHQLSPTICYVNTYYISTYKKYKSIIYFHVYV